MPFVSRNVLTAAQLNAALGDKADVNNPGHSGTMVFTGDGARIKGDFTNATRQNRLMFQTSTENGTSSVHVIPDGTATQSYLVANNSSDAGNSSRASMGATDTVTFFASDAVGSASPLPLTFLCGVFNPLTGGPDERMRIGIDGRVMIGTSTDDGVSHLQLAGALGMIGNARRITGDMSTTTFANRLAFQSSVADGATNITALPNGSSTVSSLALEGLSSAASCSVAQLICIDAAEVRLQAAIRTGGTYVPITVYAGNAERLRVKTTGQVKFTGLASAPAGAEAGDVYYDSGTNKHYGYNGSWNALY